MTKYNLEEFKQWLEEKPERKKNNVNLNWNSIFNSFADGRESFEAIAQGKPKGSWSNDPTRIFKTWIAEVDHQTIIELEQQIKALTLLATTRKEALQQEKTALIQLAQKKITNQKEAKALLKELSEKWSKEKGELNQEIQTLTKTNKTLTQTKENQQQRILALEADKQDLIQQLTNQKQKHQTYQQKQKQLLEKEIKLIKEVLNE